MRILDVAGGTGDIAFRLCEMLKQNSCGTSINPDRPADITVCDINESMLKVGEERAHVRKLGQKGIEYLCMFFF